MLSSCFYPLRGLLQARGGGGNHDYQPAAFTFTTIFPPLPPRTARSSPFFKGPKRLTETWSKETPGGFTGRVTPRGQNGFAKNGISGVGVAIPIFGELATAPRAGVWKVPRRVSIQKGYFPKESPRNSPGTRSPPHRMASRTRCRGDHFDVLPF